MLMQLFGIVCLTSTVLSQDAINSALPWLYRPQSQLKDYQPSFFTENAKAGGDVGKLSKTSMPAICPANEVLLQIENILTNLLKDEGKRSHKYNELNLMQQDNGPFNKVTAIKSETMNEKLLIPLSKQHLLRGLLENNNAKGNVKTKVTVHYELPGDTDVNCKEALSDILQILKKANLIRDHYSTCEANDINCHKENMIEIKNDGNDNILTTINQGINNIPDALSTLFNQKKSSNYNGLIGLNHDLSTIVKEPVFNKNNYDITSMFENYEPRESQSAANVIQTMSNQIPKVVTKPADVLNTNTHSLVQNNAAMIQDNNPPYQLHITENFLSPPHTTGGYNDQHLNLSGITEENFHLEDTQTPSQSPINQDFNVDKIPDDVLVTVTNDGKIVSVYPSKNKLFKKSDNNVANGEVRTFDVDKSKPYKTLPDYASMLQSVPSHAKNLFNFYLKDNTNKIPGDKINDLLSILKSGDDKYNYLTTGLQGKEQFNQFPQQLAVSNVQYPNKKPYYINPNLFLLNTKTYPARNTQPPSSVDQIPYWNTEHKEYYTYYGNPNGQSFGNLNLFDLNKRNMLANQKSDHQIAYVNENPHVVNSNLVDYGKHVSQLYTPYNLENLQRLKGVTNHAKLNSASDNSGMVELTYILRRPNPVVYQPVYFVKYRLPYESFMNNLRDLVQRKPHLRTNQAKLYQELLSISNVAEISPNLKGLGQQQLLQMTANNGALVKTKLVRVNDTLLDKKLRAVQDLNSNLAPKEIVNVTHLLEPKFGYSTKEQDVLSEAKSELSEKTKSAPGSFNRDIFYPIKTQTVNFNEISTGANPN